MSISSKGSSNPDLRDIPTFIGTPPVTHRLSLQVLSSNQRASSQHSLKSDFPLRQAQSLDGGKLRKPSKTGTVSVQVIDENQEYSFISPPQGQMLRNSTRSSATSEKISRKYGQYARPINGVGNPGFTGSNASSLHGGSVNSLPVIREQYCCCSRWSKLERNLLIVVGVLGAVIICLLVIVTIMSRANPENRSERWWAL